MPFGPAPCSGSSRTPRGAALVRRRGLMIRKSVLLGEARLNSNRRTRQAQQRRCPDVHASTRHRAASPALVPAPPPCRRLGCGALLASSVRDLANECHVTTIRRARAKRLTNMGSSSRSQGPPRSRWLRPARTQGRAVTIRSRQGHSLVRTRPEPASLDWSRQSGPSDVRALRRGLEEASLGSSRRYAFLLTTTARF
jgi:hypothetical protein